MLIYGVGFGEFITLITPIAGAASYFFKILFAKHKLFFFSISGLNSHGFSLICSAWRHLKKIFKHTELFKKNEINFLFNLPQIWVGVQRLSNCKIFLNELFCGGLHLHCLTLSLQILIVMLSMLIRSCLTVFPMNRAPGFMRSVTRSVYCIVLAVHLFVGLT